MGLDQYVYKRNKNTGEEQELAYWRKNNQLQGWFEKNTGMQNTEMVTLSVDMCNKIIDDIRAGLEPTEGFFYGNFNMDKKQEEELVNQFEEFAAIIDDGEYEVYYYCWY